MKRLFFTLLLLAGAAASPAAERPRQLDKAKVLPLALDDAFEFRKTKALHHDRATEKPTIDPMVIFERQRLNFGAVSDFDRELRYGHYFTFFWRAKRAADLTVRFEYRQQNLGAYVLAKELFYKDVKGSVKSDFSSGMGARSGWYCVARRVYAARISSCVAEGFRSSIS